MEKTDCQIIFLNKDTYDFHSKDFVKAMEWAQKRPVWAIKTPWGIFQPMDAETFEHIRDAVFDGPELDGASYGED